MYAYTSIFGIYIFTVYIPLAARARVRSPRLLFCSVIYAHTQWISIAHITNGILLALFRTFILPFPSERSASNRNMNDIIKVIIVLPIVQCYCVCPCSTRCLSFRLWKYICVLKAHKRMNCDADIYMLRCSFGTIHVVVMQFEWGSMHGNRA